MTLSSSVNTAPIRPLLRLTWGQTHHYAFSSAWLIFSKIAILNQMSPKIQFELFSDNTVTEKTVLPYWSSEGINLQMLASAIGLDIKFVRLAFLDQIAPTKKSRPGYFRAPAIRHCPKCISAGYHCVFFNIELMTHCPIHDLTLVQCAHCTGFLRYHSKRHGALLDPDNPEDSIANLYHLPCGHLNLGADGTFIHSPMSEEDRYAIVVIMEKIKSWLQPTHPNLFERHCLRLFTNQFQWAPEIVARETRWSRQGYLLGKLEALSGPCPINVNATSVTPKFHQWVEHWRGKCPPDDLIAEGCDVIPVYKSIRRHFKRTFLRGHLKCGLKLLEGPPRNVYCIHESMVCWRTLVFLAWRSIFENGLIEWLLHGKYIDLKVSSCLGTFHQIGRRATVNGFAVCAYASFFTTLSRIAQNAKVAGSLELYSRAAPLRDFFSPSEWTAYFDLAGEEGCEALHNTSRHTIAFPDCSLIVETLKCFKSEEELVYELPPGHWATVFYDPNSRDNYDSCYWYRYLLIRIIFDRKGEDEYVLV